jgi:diguanylate cyclase (GGDEF)-like protein
MGLKRKVMDFCRLGGEEFAVALMETDMSAALETAERLRQEIAAEPFQVAAGNIQMTVSVGAATTSEA